MRNYVQEIRLPQALITRCWSFEIMRSKTLRPRLFVTWACHALIRDDTFLSMKSRSFKSEGISTHFHFRTHLLGFECLPKSKRLSNHESLDNERDPIWTDDLVDVPVTGITRATTAPRILDWICRSLQRSVACPELVLHIYIAYYYQCHRNRSRTVDWVDMVESYNTTVRGKVKGHARFSFTQ